MAENRDITSAGQRNASEIFAAWLRSGAGDFEKLCHEHPERTGELRKLHAAFDLGRAAATSRSFHQMLEKNFSDAEEITVKLEEGFGVPPSGGKESEPAKAGTASASRYALEGEVARGGMGIIFRVKDRDLSRTLAMKVMTGAHGPSAQATNATTRINLARFLEEAQVTAQLDHPGIVPVHEVGFDAQGQPFFTMKLVKGRDLNEIFKLARAGEGWSEARSADSHVREGNGVEQVSEAVPHHREANAVADKAVRAPSVTEGWNLPRAVGVIVKACQAVAFAHSKGVIHRDLKPANIMVGRFGEVYVMDWGLAKVTGRKDLHDIRPKDTQLTSASFHSPRREAATESTPDSPLITLDGSVVGTPAYMPPEQARGQVEKVDQASDIYSLGAILYNLLAGQPPYVEPGARISPHTILARVLDGPPKRVHQLNAQAPPELLAICEKAMAREKRDRYASSLDLAEDLQAFLDHRVVKAYRTGAVAEFKSWVKRNKRLAALSAVVAVLPAIGVAVFIYQQNLAKERLRRNAYAADMRVAFVSLDERNLGRATELARRYLPRPGETDLRGFEWRFLWQQCRGEETHTFEHASIVNKAIYSPDGPLNSRDIRGKIS